MAWNFWILPVMVFLIPILPIFGLQICLLIFLARLFLRPKAKTIGFMHPNASASGGGERVLWAAVQSLRTHFEDYEIIIYLRADEKLTESEIIASTKKCFGLDLSQNPPIFIKINGCKYADPHKYKFLTLIMEALGSILATLESVIKHPPEIFIDTTGYGFALTIPKIIAGCKTAAYIHYPIISTDMINDIYSGASFNHGSCMIMPVALCHNAKIMPLA